MHKEDCMCTVDCFMPILVQYRRYRTGFPESHMIIYIYRWVLQINIITFICIMFMAIGWVTLVVLPIYIITVVQASRAAEGEKQNTAKQHLQVSEDNTILQDFNDSRHLGRPEFSRYTFSLSSDGF